MRHRCMRGLQDGTESKDGFLPSAEQGRKWTGVRRWIEERGDKELRVGGKESKWSTANVSAQAQMSIYQGGIPAAPGPPEEQRRD